jgi:NADH-quinone oxidoreductase subunit D
VHEPLRVLVGSLGLGALPSARSIEPPKGTILLDLGAEHPSQAGLIELRLWAEDGLITRAEVVIGAMHRGAEKLFEVRDYRQILMLADRHDWHAPFSGELLIALACEQLLGLTVPVRAVWLRTLLAEHTRILSHCAFLSYVSPRGRGAVDLVGLREDLRGQTMLISGNRIHPMINRVGGLAADADDRWLRAEVQVATRARATGEQLASLINSDSITRLASGVAKISRTTIEQFGISGPAARASGVDLDLRLRRPYLAYGELAELIAGPAATAGDAASRLSMLAEEVITSASLIMACVERLFDLPGPVSVKLGKIIRLPDGEAYVAIEAPLGIAGAFVVSRGEKTPWRLKLRTPSFSNVSALESILVGVRIEALEATLASIGYVVGDVDR